MTKDQVALILETMNRRFDAVDKRFEGIDKRLDGMDKQLDGMDKRLDGMDKRLDGVDKRLDGVDSRFDMIDQSIRKMAVEQGAKLESLAEKLAEHDKHLMEKIDRLEFLKYKDGQSSRNDGFANSADQSREEHIMLKAQVDRLEERVTVLEVV
jgi:chromosome segregation ATPase